MRHLYGTPVRCVLDCNLLDPVKCTTMHGNRVPSMPAWILLIVAVAVSGCGYVDLFGLRTIPPALANVGHPVDIEVGQPFVDRQGRQLLFDLYRPVHADGPRPLVVVIFGDSWSKGSRDQLVEYAYDLAANGYVAAAIDYRLVDEQTVFPSQVADVLAAISFLRENADSYGIDADRVATFGASAGALLALVAGLSDDVSQFDPDFPPGHSMGVRAVVNLFGPTDLTVGTSIAPSQIRTVERFLGRRLDEAPDLRQAASPITYVRADGPAVLTFHGDADSVVPVSHARTLDQAMSAVGQTHVLVEVPGMEHVVGAIWISPQAQAFRPVLFQFLADHL